MNKPILTSTPDLDKFSSLFQRTISNSLLASIIGFSLCAFLFQRPVNAFQIDTTDTVLVELDSSTNNLGNYTIIGEFDSSGSVGLGTIQDVLRYSEGGGGGGEASRSTSMETILNTIANDLTGTNTLVFYVGLNEGGNNQADILFQDIEMTFEVPENPDGTGTTQLITFNLAVDDDTVNSGSDVNTDLDLDIVTNGGQDSGEVKFQVNFDFELFSAYGYTNSTSPGVASNYNYTITPTTLNEDGGDDRFYLSSGLTAAAQQAIPFEFSPSLGIILSLGFFGFSTLKNCLPK